MSPNVPLCGERHEADEAKEVAQEDVLLHPQETRRWRSPQSGPVLACFCGYRYSNSKSSIIEKTERWMK